MFEAQQARVGWSFNIWLKDLPQLMNCPIETIGRNFYIQLRPQKIHDLLSAQATP
jgi:hypothetical protein